MSETPRLTIVCVVADEQGDATLITHEAPSQTPLTTSLTYNAFSEPSEGELISASDSEGNTSYFAYEDGREVKSTDPLGHETRIAYNGVDLPTSVTNPEGQSTEYAYDQDNELTSETDPAGEKTSYTYDPDGNLASVTDPRGHTQTTTG